MAPDGRGIQFAQILNTLAADEAMVNAAHQLQKRGERCGAMYFRQQNLTVMPTSAVNDHVLISPNALDRGIQPSKSKSYRTNDNPTNMTCESMPGLMRLRLALEM
jgi:hypothetical protein